MPRNLPPCPDCGGPKSTKTGARCRKCYFGQLRAKPKPECSEPGCTSVGAKRGMCDRHRRRDIRATRGECSVDGCSALADKRGWCPTHYKRMRKTGSLSRTCQRCGREAGDVNSLYRLHCEPCRLKVRSEKQRRSDLKKNFGITVEQYDAMLAGQGGGCAICRAKVSGGRGRRLHVDHDHVTGQIRGLLCHGCNTGLGGLKDDPDTITAAARYVREHRQLKLVVGGRDA